MFAALERQTGLLRARFTLTNAVEVFLDPLVVVLSLIASASAVGEALGAQMVILALIAFSLTFPGTLDLTDSPRRMVRKTVLGWAMVAAILLLFGYASGYERFFTDKFIISWLAATPVALMVAHEVARITVPRVLAHGNRSTAVIAGGNEIGVNLARRFIENKYLGVQFLGFFDDRSRQRLEHVGDMPLLGSLHQLADYVKQHHIDHIYLALPMATQPRILSLLDNLKDTTCSIFFVPDIFVTDLIQGRMDNIGGMPVVAVCETPFTGANGLLKRASDIVLSSLILLLISPILAGLALGVKLSSPGPVIFKQRRYGLDGKEIVVYKFRSMTVMEDGGAVKQATKNDQRITPFGGFIRRTSLDELPQFLNVLQGRMSIVGPRPHAVSHNETYRKLIKGYMVRHKVKPGITGWAQVNGYRGETETVEKMEMRIAYDLEYLRNWSLGLDLWIIIKTALMMARGDKNAY